MESAILKFQQEGRAKNISFGREVLKKQIEKFGKMPGLKRTFTPLIDGSKASKSRVRFYARCMTNAHWLIRA